MRRDSVWQTGQGGAGFGAGAIVVGIGLAVALGWLTYTMFRIDVGTGEMAILIKKTGKDIANGDEVAPGPEYKGIQKEVLKEGRHFRNPLEWDWKVMPQIVVPKDKLGVVISLTGEDLPYGEFLAKVDDNGNVLTKGVLPDVLKPGRYALNPYLFRVEMDHEPVVVPAGFKGVVTNLAGPLPKNPNVLLVEKGERGVQKETLDPGTYYVNPYVTRISLIDCRSQRFNLADKKDMGFPSKDGFWVSLDGRIEFRVNPEKAAEVYVTYNEDYNGDAIDEEIIQKIIMPSARSFCRLEGSNNLGRDFIQGETRTRFQEQFQEAMKAACEPLGIEIIQALITSIKPPQQIAEPVRQRELAKQQELEFQQEILQQEQERVLAEKKALVEQKRALIAIEQDIVKAVKEAERMQEVEVTEAKQDLEVAKIRLEAAKDKAEAITARGKAEADVIRFQNEAEAAGWKRAVEAFDGNGRLFAQYTLYQKLASAYRRIMVNTADSPIMKVFEAFTSPGEASGRRSTDVRKSAADRPQSKAVSPATPKSETPRPKPETKNLAKPAAKER